MEILRSADFKFIEVRRKAFICSAILILAGLLSLIIRGGPNYGIDFEGGTLIQMKFMEPVGVSALRNTLNGIGYGDAIIQEFGSSKEVLIRIREEDDDALQQSSVAPKIVAAIRSSVSKTGPSKGLLDINSIGAREIRNILMTLPSLADNETEASAISDSIVAQRTEAGGLFSNISALSTIPRVTPEILDFLKGKTYAGDFIVVRQEMVGPKVGKDLRGKALLAIFWAVLGILVYISIRFRFRFAVAAIVALIHDVMITVGIFSILDREISLTIIAALLTIVGYSLNDTIVVFDRIRENSKALRSLPIAQQLNKSINMVLSRTLLTSLTTFMVVFCLFVFGGEVIRDFALALMIGVLVGTYSSVFVASPILFEWEQFVKGRKQEKASMSGLKAHPASARKVPKSKRSKK